MTRVFGSGCHAALSSRTMFWKAIHLLWICCWNVGTNAWFIQALSNNEQEGAGRERWTDYLL